jgi:radical SAM-linked protein
VKIKIRFLKSLDMRFISHLDVMRLFQRAARRAALPVLVTKGFNPHLKISITRALKLGVQSDCEEAFFYLEKEIGPDEFKTRLNQELPEGIKVLNAEIG